MDNKNEVCEFEFSGHFFSCWSNDNGQYTMIVTNNDSADMLCYVDQDLIIDLFDSMHGDRICRTFTTDAMPLMEIE